jgi:hypothetical protein
VNSSDDKKAYNDAKRIPGSEHSYFPFPEDEKTRSKLIVGFHICLWVLDVRIYLYTCLVIGISSLVPI